ncbi:MAG: hypothetical protein IPK20_08020 [Betaproteobacteria bacterium]|nr:hypothetical protein [Betaproteobacteria bacterium]
MVRPSHSLAKLMQPRLRRPVSRLQLFERLDGALAESRSIFVAGPPGAGKTTLVASWLDVRQTANLWFRVDPADRDPAAFFHYLREAVLGRSRRLRHAFPHLTPEYRSDIPGFARRFFRNMFRYVPDRSVFVFDNFQDIGSDAVMAPIMADLLSEVCGGSIVVIVSREEPPPCFARAAAEEILMRIDAADLRLTDGEAHAVARERFTGTADALAEVVKRADGWAAGLTLLLESASRQDQTARGRNASASEELFGYLATQVFEQMPPEERDFLLDTAILPFFSAAMAADLTSNARAAQIISSLYRRHLFVHATGAVERHFPVPRSVPGFSRPPGGSDAVTAAAAGRLPDSRRGVHAPRPSRTGRRSFRGLGRLAGGDRGARKR